MSAILITTIISFWWWDMVWSLVADVAKDYKAWQRSLSS